MSSKMGEVLKKDKVIGYKCNFGSTTRLEINVVNEYPIEVKEGIKLLS